MSDALIAWGVDFGDRGNTSEGFDFGGRGLDTCEMERQLPALLGLAGDDVPVRFTAYGYELGGQALVLRRSLTTTDWACQAVDPRTLAPPTGAEAAAVAAVFARWDIDWPQDIKLLLMAR